METAPVAILSIWSMAAIAALWFSYHREKRRRRISRSLQSAVRGQMRAA
jgi:hypothetical protein